MRCHILSIFPEIFSPFVSCGMIKRAQEKGLFIVQVHDLRDYTTDRHRSVDDVPYGGGAGMVMKVEPVDRALTALGAIQRRILLSPQGRLLSQAIARELASEDSLALICGRYEGVDERVREMLVDDEISIGDYVLTGGEIPAMVLIESVIRFIPGVLGCEDSLAEETFAQKGLLEYPHYTRPEEYRAWKVPDILLSGHHRNIKEWRHRQSLLRTAQRRPELIVWSELTQGDRDWLAQNGIELREGL